LGRVFEDWFELANHLVNKMVVHRGRGLMV